MVWEFPKKIRSIFSKKNGNVAGAGSVAWIFEKKGYIEIDKKSISEDKLMSIVLDAGAQDMESQEEIYSITTDPKDLRQRKKHSRPMALNQRVQKLQCCQRVL